MHVFAKLFEWELGNLNATIEGTNAKNTKYPDELESMLSSYHQLNYQE